MARTTTPLTPSRAAALCAVSEAFKNQDRLRENIKSLEKVTSSKLTDRYLNEGPR